MVETRRRIAIGTEANLSDVERSEDKESLMIEEPISEI